MKDASNEKNLFQGGRPTTSTEMFELRSQLHRKLLSIVDLNTAKQLSSDELYAECSRQVDILLGEQHCPLSAPEKRKLLQDVMDSIFGLGPLEEYLRDRNVSDILVNGANNIYIERFGKLERTSSEFASDSDLLRVIQRIGNRVGRRIDESSPMLDARLSDGSRVNAIIPPLALDGPSLSIRRFGTIPIEASTLIELGTVAEEMPEFLQACVQCKANILLSGGTGTGKTTMLNILSRWVPEGERVVTIEDAAELQLQRDHVVRLETRPPNIEGRGEVTQRELLRNCLRMRPDRIIIGEVRGAEALDMLQAMNTGHEGSMTTVHANNPRDAFLRVENMVSISGLNLPHTTVRQQLSSAINLLIQLGRLTGGVRKVMNISEVTGMEGDMILLQDVFRFKQTDVGSDGKAKGQFECCGVRPKFLARLEEEGISFPGDFFQRRVLRKV